MYELSHSGFCTCSPSYYSPTLSLSLWPGAWSLDGTDSLLFIKKRLSFFDEGMYARNERERERERERGGGAFFLLGDGGSSP
jgi:hypothetical protein